MGGRTRMKIDLNNLPEGAEIIKIDWDKRYRQQKEREEQEREERKKVEEIEKNRVDAIQCPVCKSTDKHHHTKHNHNGICGPGSRSWKVEDYLICLGCGVHYTDLERIKRDKKK
jgi:hypothetical protein